MITKIINYICINIIIYDNIVCKCSSTYIFNKKFQVSVNTQCDQATKRRIRRVARSLSRVGRELFSKHEKHSEKSETMSVFSECF